MSASGSCLASAYDGLLLDIDGTVVRGRSVLPGIDALLAVRAKGRGVVFVTNNASRSAEAVAGELTELGIAVDAGEVVTSGQAGAALLAGRVAPGAAILVTGTDALAAEVRERGLTPVTSAEQAPVGVIQGHSPHLTWPMLAETCLAVQAGCDWVACNGDTSLPTERGFVPGNGAIIAAVHAVTGRLPLVAGKPERPLLDSALDRTGGRDALVVGDRLGTDIGGANAAGLDSLLVLSGVTDPAALLAAPPTQRPTYVARDLSSLLADPDSLRVAAQPGWRCEATDAGLLLEATGSEADSADGLAALRTLAAAWWKHGQGVPDVSAADERSRRALGELGVPARRVDAIG